MKNIEGFSQYSNFLSIYYDGVIFHFLFAVSKSCSGKENNLQEDASKLAVACKCICCCITCMHAINKSVIKPMTSEILQIFTHSMICKVDFKLMFWLCNHTITNLLSKIIKLQSRFGKSVHVWQETSSQLPHKISLITVKLSSHEIPIC